MSVTLQTDQESESASGLVTTPVKLQFIFNRVIREEHQEKIYGLCCMDSLFASVAGGSVSVYCINEDSSCDLKLAYIDEDTDETFYCCAWAFTDEPILLVGGVKGSIKAINVARNELECCFIGHGNAVNDVKVHPVDQNLVLSASKDESIRLWNLKTHACIAIFCGHSGHRDEVLSIAIHPLGNCFVSGGLDSTMKIWSLDGTKIRSLIVKSYGGDRSKESSVEFIQFPEFSTNLVHNNFIDSVNWYGNFILSNAVNDKVALWAPDPSRSAGDIVPLQLFKIPHMNVWFLSLAINIELDVFAVGNNIGKIYIYRLADCLPGGKCGEEKVEGTKRKSIAGSDESYMMNGNANAFVVLQHPRCNRIIRSVVFTEDNNYLLASCDDSSIWVWNIRSIVMESKDKKKQPP